MTIAENRAAARAYRADKEQRFREERHRADLAADLEALRALRDYLIYKARMGSPDGRQRLRAAIDDYAGEITGDRTALHSKTSAG